MVTKARLGRSAPELRRDHILSVARDVFMEDGFAGASMSTIAARLGGSKATLYKYFPSKEQLFEEMMAETCREVLASLADAELPDDDVRGLLRGYGLGFLRALYRPIPLSLARLVHAEGERFPEVARIFFAKGPDVGHRQLADRLTGMAERGVIRCAQPLLTTEQFLGMLRGDLHMRVVCGIAPIPSDAVIEAHVDNAVALIAPGLEAKG
ncbi:TetR/AcrR family transcriptional regulator [Phenylobacterium sp. LjRoot225]|uniref:TetR/AcrR family transcriptional regulator n=1 Tax=Phenylobacterium sp. LjRoot225 TaxID=3342285 RepID=UPI003ECE3CBB